MNTKIRTYRVSDEVHQLLQKKRKNGQTWDDFFREILGVHKEKKELKVVWLPKWKEDSMEYRLADFMYRSLLNNDEKAKKPNLQKWADVFDKILRIDKRDHEEVVLLIRFAHAHDFWKSNILSPDKLRKQYSKLLIQCKGEAQKHMDKQQKKKPKYSITTSPTNNDTEILPKFYG